MQMKQFAGLVRKIAAASGPKVYHRVHFKDVTIAANASTGFDLLTCDDDPNYDVTSDGTNVAEIHPESRVIRLQLVMGLYVDSNPIVGGPLEWLLGRDPDSALTASSMTMATLMASDVNAGVKVLRANTWATGHMFLTTTKGQGNSRVIVSRKALRRSRVFHDGDKLRIVFTNPDADTAAKLYLRGRIISRLP